MEAISTHFAARRNSRGGSLNLSAILHAGACASLGALAALALFVLARAAGGAFLRPLQIPQVLLVSLVLGILGAALRRLVLRNSRPAKPTPSPTRADATRRMAHVATTSTVILAASLAYPGGWPTIGLAGLCLAAVEILARPLPLLRIQMQVLAARAQSADVLSGTWQQWSRKRSATEEDVWEGWQRVQFQPGQRTASIHLTFCPPFDSVPQLTYRPLAGPEARIEIAQLWPYAARIDLRLNRPALEITDVRLGLRATCKAPAFPDPSN